MFDIRSYANIESPCVILQNVCTISVAHRFGCGAGFEPAVRLPDYESIFCRPVIE
jgi:hypothetical protein